MKQTDPSEETQVPMLNTERLGLWCWELEVERGSAVKVVMQVVPQPPDLHGRSWLAGLLGALTQNPGTSKGEANLTFLFPQGSFLKHLLLLKEA